MPAIALIKTVAPVTGIGDLTRFSNPRQLMAYFDLVPGERTSGEIIRREGIIKFVISHLSGNRSDHRSEKLEHQPTLEIEPENFATRFTRRAHHDHLDQSSAMC